MNAPRTFGDLLLQPLRMRNATCHYCRRKSRVLRISAHRYSYACLACIGTRYAKPLPTARHADRISHKEVLHGIAT